METVWEETVLRRGMRKTDARRKPNMTCAQCNYKMAKLATLRTDWL